MRSAKCLVLATLLCGTLVGISPAYSETSFGSALYEALSQNNLLERRFEPLIRRVFGTLLDAIHFPLPLRLNEKYAEGSLNLYVVTTNYSLNNLTLPQGLVRETLKATTDNAVALPPDILVFDAAFLAEHIVNAWNLQIAVAQGLAERAARIQLGLPEDEASNPLAAFARMADVYRFRNIGNRFADGANSVTVLTQRINQALNQGQDSSRMFVFSLAPILYHELGHLHDGTSGSFLEFLQDVARYFASPKILQREEAADQFAVEKMQELALAIPHFDFYDYESMTSSVLLMRDTVLFDVFSGFRALPSEDHFIHLVHEDCRRNPSTADFNFYDPRKVKFAFHDFFSFLTAGEFAELHRKVLATIGAGTHAHNFVRGARIINALTTLAGQVSAPSDDNLMDWYTHFLAAMQKNDPQFLTERLTPAERLAEAVEPYRMILNLVGSGATGLGLKFKSFSRSLDLDYQPVINCPPGMCMVGFLKDGQKGFVEIGGPLDNLSSIRLVFPLFGDNPREVLSSKDPGAYLRGIGFLRRFLLAALDIPEGEADALDAVFPLEDLAPIARKCGAITLTARHNGKSVLLTSVDPDFWISAVILP